MNRLRQVRKSKGLTLVKVAEDTGVSIANLSRYEREDVDPKRETWVKLADYYDVPVSYLMGFPDGLVQHINKTQAMATDDIKSNRLRKLRKKQGLTLKQVAEDTGIAESTLSQYETKKREPRHETWVKLADYYDVPVAY